VAYVDGKQVVDVWGGLADITTGRQVDADTVFPVFSVTKAVTAVALHIQAERGLVDYAMPIAHLQADLAVFADGGVNCFLDHAIWVRCHSTPSRSFLGGTTMHHGFRKIPAPDK
jgi:hypothetical protein